MKDMAKEVTRVAQDPLILRKATRLSKKLRKTVHRHSLKRRKKLRMQLIEMKDFSHLKLLLPPSLLLLMLLRLKLLL